MRQRFFLTEHKNSQILKKKLKNWTSSKLKFPAQQMTLLGQWLGRQRMENIFTTSTCNNELMSRLGKNHKSIILKIGNQRFWKFTKHLNRHFTKEDT